MGLKKNDIEKQKRVAEGKLAARQELLRARGLDEKTVGRDPLVRKARAEIRRSARRLQRALELEKQNAELA